MPTSTSLRVLVAEDDAALNELLQAIVVRAGHIVVGSAYNGREAVELTTRLQPDALLLDIVMPDPDTGLADKQAGLRAAETIMAVCPTPIVLVTAYESQELLAYSSRLGVGAYLIKPPRPGELERALIIARARFVDLEEMRRLNAALQIEIGERQRAERRLKQQAAWAQFVSDAILATDLNRRITAWNEAATRIYGWDAAEAIGQELDHLLKTEFIGITQAEAQAILAQDGLWQGQLRQHTKSGEARYIEASVTFLRDEAEAVVGGITVNRDITERRQAEESLRVKDRAMMTSINALAISDLAGRLTYVNPAFLTLWGYADDHAVLGQSVTKFWQFAEAAAEVVHAVQTAGGWMGELIGLRPDGSSFDAQVSASLVTNESGQPTFMLASFLDITTRKQAEKELRESEARYRRLVEGAPGVVYTFSSQRGGLYYSPRVEQVLGYPLEYLCDHPFLWNEAIHPDDRPRVVEAVREAQAGRSFDIEYRVRHALGEWRWLMDRSIDCRVVNGEVLIEGLATDITERKRAEQALQETLIHLNAILNALPDLMFEVDRDGIIHDYHAPHYELLYAPPAAFLGKTIDQVLPADAAVVIKAAVAQAARQGTAFGAIYSLPLPQGTVWFELSIAAEGDLQAPAVRFVVLVRNITAHQQAEAALRELNDRLEQRVADRTRELAETNARLIELGQLKDQFIDRINHELRSPLFNIKIHSHLLLTDKPEKRAAHQQVVEEKIAELEQKISDLLDVSYLTLNDFELHLLPLNVNAVLHELVTERTALALQRRLTLQSQLAPDLPLAVADRIVLRQVVTNLLSNALNYTPPGGRIEVRTAQRRENNTDWVTIEVRDTGSGLFEEDLAHLFEPFYRGTAARDYKAPGMGVGLFIARRFIERMQGQLVVESAPGQGATFTVWLKTASSSF